jgi:hypothetical protein
MNRAAGAAQGGLSTELSLLQERAPHRPVRRRSLSRRARRAPLDARWGTISNHGERFFEHIGLERL